MTSLTKTLTKTPRLFLHLEGLTLLLLAVLVYSQYGFSWAHFFIFLLAPDLTGILYLIDKPLFTLVYNLAHTHIFPLALGAVSVLTGNLLGLQIALIWLSHIGLDRTVGYGFKYADQPQETHLSRV